MMKFDPQKYIGCFEDLKSKSVVEIEKNNHLRMDTTSLVLSRNYQVNFYWVDNRENDLQAYQDA